MHYFWTKICTFIIAYNKNPHDEILSCVVIIDREHSRLKGRNLYFSHNSGRYIEAKITKRKACVPTNRVTLFLFFESFNICRNGFVINSVPKMISKSWHAASPRSPGDHVSSQGYDKETASPDHPAPGQEGI